MAYPATYQEPFTKYPNRYNDVIKPLLTDTQRDVCDVVIRMTYGWHQTSAEISNSVFVNKTGKSKQGIIKAKNQLEEKGLLIVLEKGGGSRTNEYMLDFWYDNPDKSIKASMLQQEEQEDIVELSEEVQPEIEEDPNCNTSEEPDLEQGISDTEAAINPGRIEDSETSTSKLSLPPCKEDLGNSIIYNKNKQIENSANEEIKSERKKAIATVCFFFKSFGLELEEKDYAFVGWCIKEFGIESVNKKIQIMKFQRSRGVKFSNPLGWLRSGLMRDYGFCKWDSEVMKAKERARKELERSRLEQMQRECEIQEAERSRDKVEKMKAQLVPKDREDLRKAAIEHISEMGISSNWINEPLIESIENQIVRERNVVGVLGGYKNG